jgi:DNA-binding NarL/FixJ family response regulator
MQVYILDKGGSGTDKILAWLMENKQVREITVLKGADNFLDRVRLLEPDLAFIRLGDDDIPGLQTGRMIKEAGLRTRVVFVSLDKKHALEAFDIGAYGYLLSPIDKKKFEKIIA